MKKATYKVEFFVEEPDDDYCFEAGECSMCPYCNQSWNEEYPTMTCNLGFDIFKCKLEAEEVKEGVENNGE